MAHGVCYVGHKSCQPKPVITPSEGILYGIDLLIELLHSAVEYTTVEYRIDEYSRPTVQYSK